MAVHTLFVEPFNPIIGAQYLVLGEIEKAEGKEGSLVAWDCRIIFYCSFYFGPHNDQNRH